MTSTMGSLATLVHAALLKDRYSSTGLPRSQCFAVITGSTGFGPDLIDGYPDVGCPTRWSTAVHSTAASSCSSTSPRSCPAHLKPTSTRLPLSSSSDPEGAAMQLARKVFMVLAWSFVRGGGDPVPPRRPRDPRRRELGATSTVGLRRVASHPRLDVDRCNRRSDGPDGHRHDDRRLRAGVPPAALRCSRPRPAVAPIAPRAERSVHRRPGLRPRASRVIYRPRSTP